MAQSFSVEAILKATDKNFSKVFGDAEKNTEGFKGKVSNAMKTTGKVVAGATAAITGVGVAAFAATKKVTENFDNISKGAQKVGITTDAYQEMDYWASQNGLSSDNMEKAVGRLNQRIGMAADGNDKYAGALEKLGVNMGDVKNGTVSTEEVMAQSIQSLSEITNKNEQAALASELFGTKLSREMLPALQDGALSLEDAKAKAEELGIVIGEDSLAAGVKFQDTWDSLKRTMGAAGQKIMAELIPVFQTMMDWVIENMPMIQDTFQVVFDAIKVVFDVFGGVIETVIEKITEFKDNNSETFENIRDTITEIMTNVWEKIQEVWDFIVTIWEENGQEILDNAKTIFDEIWQTISTVLELIQEIFNEIMSWVVPFVKEKLDELFKFWDENGEQIMQAVQNMYEFIRQAFQWIVDAVMPIVKYLWSQIEVIIDTGIGIVMGLIKIFTGLFTGDFSKMKEGALEIFGALWDGVKGLVSNAWGLISGAFSGLWDKISGWFTGLKDDAKEWGKNMIDGFIGGIKNMYSKVTEAVSGVIDSVGDFLGFNSPAKKGEGRNIVKWGANMIDGFLDGVKSKIRDAENAVGSIVSSMQPSDLKPIGIDVNGSVAQVRSTVSHELSGGVGSQLDRLAAQLSKGQVIVLDSGELVGATYPQYDRAGGNRTQITERWGR